MAEVRKKGDGYDRVRLYILKRLRTREHPEETYVRITGAEMADAVGLSAQAVNEHVRRLVRRGEFVRQRRCYFGKPAPASEPCASCKQDRNGYETVREIILERIRHRPCKEDLFVRLNAEEIGARVGLTAAAVRFHLRNLIRRGVICRACDGGHYYAAVREVQREQLRCWIHYRIQSGVFSDEPLLFFDPVDAAGALHIPELEIGGYLRELTMMDAAFRSVALIEPDDERLKNGKEESP